MPNSRSITPEIWDHVRRALVVYFTHHYQALNAEDLAQETILALYGREDYEFEKIEDFLKVCYGFAKNTAKSAKRKEDRHVASELDDFPAEVPPNYPAKTADNEIFVREVMRVGQSQLTPRQWEAICRAAGSKRANLHSELGFDTANSFRVFLHRARKELARLTGYRVVR